MTCLSCGDAPHPGPCDPDGHLRDIYSTIPDRTWTLADDLLTTEAVEWYLAAIDGYAAVVITDDNSPGATAVGLIEIPALWGSTMADSEPPDTDEIDLGHFPTVDTAKTAAERWQTERILNDRLALAAELAAEAELDEADTCPACRRIALVVSGVTDDLAAYRLVCSACGTETIRAGLTS